MQGNYKNSSILLTKYEIAGSFLEKSLEDCNRINREAVVFFLDRKAFHCKRSIFIIQSSRSHTAAILKKLNEIDITAGGSIRKINDLAKTLIHSQGREGGRTKFPRRRIGQWVRGGGGQAGGAG